VAFPGENELALYRQFTLSTDLTDGNIDLNCVNFIIFLKSYVTIALPGYIPLVLIFDRSRFDIIKFIRFGSSIYKILRNLKLSSVMADLKIKYMGLELKNPVIIGANDIITKIENLKKIEEAGAAAVVYKSLFEEQVQLENLELYEQRTEYEERNAEMITLFPWSKSESSGPEQYLSGLKAAKEAVNIPVFGSLNAIHSETWVEYAKKIEATGVDGIELNFYKVPDVFDGELVDIEKRQIKALKDVKRTVKIPVCVKLSPFYNNLLKVISDMDKAGADAFVLFNRFFQPDIDIQKEEHRYPYNLSNEEDNRLPLRFAGLLYGNINASITANSGIFSGQDAIKMILAGADSVQVVSTLYKNSIGVISTIVTEIDEWMNAKGYKTINDFRGRLSNRNLSNKLPYQRAQYLDILMNSSEIMKKYKLLS
jgi:dihydroorotate dehydrogenase (fumarate)